jgi:ferric-dicitrate binding protein FerR (iron transport regulator)
MSSRVSRLLSLFLIFALPTSLLCAETHAAMVFATGMASLNGSALARSTAVFAGDVLETSKNSAIIINANGSTVQMASNSRLQFQGEAIDVDSGAAQVTTNSGMKVQADALTVSPMNNTAKYQVTRASGKVLVAALNGSVSVLNGKTSDVLTAGETKTYSDGQDDKDSKKNRDGGAVVYTSDKALFWWGAAALATGGTLAYLFLRDGRKPLSNQLP